MGKLSHVLAELLDLLLVHAPTQRDGLLLQVYHRAVEVSLEAA